MKAKKVISFEEDIDPYKALRIGRHNQIHLERIFNECYEFALGSDTFKSVSSIKFDATISDHYFLLSSKLKSLSSHHLNEFEEWSVSRHADGDDDLENSLYLMFENNGHVIEFTTVEEFKDITRA